MASSCRASSLRRPVGTPCSSHGRRSDSACSGRADGSMAEAIFDHPWWPRMKRRGRFHRSRGSTARPHPHAQVASSSLICNPLRTLHANELGSGHLRVSPKRHVNRHNRHHAPVSRRGVAKAFPRRWLGVSGSAETPSPASQIASTHFTVRADTDKSASTPSHRLTENIRGRARAARN